MDPHITSVPTKLSGGHMKIKLAWKIEKKRKGEEWSHLEFGYNQKLFKHCLGISNSDIVFGSNDFIFC